MKGVAAVACSDSAPDPQAAFRFIARQPILDVDGRVRAYELLFRNGVDSVFRGDGELASQTMIDNSVLFGFSRFTNGLPAFVNCTAEILTGDTVRLLPEDLTVLEVLETVEPTAEVVAACRRLKAVGYRLALDDFIYRPDLDPLIEIADYIKVEYMAGSDSQRVRDLARLMRFKGTLLAEKVEDQVSVERAREEGCSLFQGYYFFRPTIVTRKKVPANRHIHVQLLEMLQRDVLDLIEIVGLVKSDPSLAYRLIRRANSPLYAFRNGVSSFRSALLLIGDDEFRRIALLAVASELNCGPSAEIVRMALIRARFCEVSATFYALDSREQYLVGLFSLLPAMLQVPMEDAIEDLPVRETVRNALLGAESPMRSPLEWLENREQGKFQRTEAMALAHGLDSRLLNDQFTEATFWADRLLVE